MDIKQHYTKRTTVVMLVDLDESPDDVLRAILLKLDELGCGNFELGWTHGLKAVIINEFLEGAGWIIGPENFYEDVVSFLRDQRGMLHDQIDLTPPSTGGGHFDGHDWRLEFTVEAD